MARAYSDDLRRKFLEAHRQGEGSLAELAERFHVSEGWAEKISATLRRTGKMERPAGGKRGPKSRLTPEAAEYLRSRVKEQPDRTLAELRDAAQELGVRLIVCEAGLRMTGLENAALAEGVQVAGVVTFLESTKSGQIISL